MVPKKKIKKSKNLKWHGSDIGIFSCALAFMFLYHTGITSPHYKFMWKIKVPMKVKIFLWLMLEDKILTQEVLGVRGCIVQSGCHLCDSTATESRDHLMWECPFARRFWRGLGAQHNIVIGNNVEGILKIWIQGHYNWIPRQRIRWNIIWAA